TVCRAGSCTVGKPNWVATRSMAEQVSRTAWPSTNLLSLSRELLMATRAVLTSPTPIHAICNQIDDLQGPSPPLTNPPQRLSSKLAMDSAHLRLDLSRLNGLCGESLNKSL